MYDLQGRRFFAGMILGMVLSLVAAAVTLYFMTMFELVSVTVGNIPQVEDVTRWLRRNLGLSVFPFGITLALYVYSLRALAKRLENDSPQDEVAQYEHLTDVWTSLFFGIGVIWTAIGMRSALLFALGDPGVTADLGAFAVLQRLVDGGILTALTTTILGGTGGYLMRVAKSFLLGASLSRYYEEQDRRHSARIEQLLQQIRESMGGTADVALPATCSPAQAK